MTNDEVKLFLKALTEIVSKISDLEKDYVYITRLNEYIHKSEVNNTQLDGIVKNWFSLE